MTWNGPVLEEDEEKHPTGPSFFFLLLYIVEQTNRWCVPVNWFVECKRTECVHAFNALKRDLDSGLWWKLQHKLNLHMHPDLHFDACFFVSEQERLKKRLERNDLPTNNSQTSRLLGRPSALALMYNPNSYPCSIPHLRAPAWI